MAARSEYQKIAHSDYEKQLVAQPLEVTGARVFQFSDGRAGLILDIENFEVPILLSSSDVEHLRGSLSELEARRKSPLKTSLQ